MATTAAPDQRSAQGEAPPREEHAHRYRRRWIPIVAVGIAIVVVGFVAPTWIGPWAPLAHWGCDPTGVQSLTSRTDGLRRSW
jgi:hypothetical protein